MSNDEPRAGEAPRPGARRYRRTEKLVAWTLVTAQFVLLAGLVLGPGPRLWPVSWWLVALAVLALAGSAWLALAAVLRLGPGLTASPLPAGAARLQTTGVYAYVRHPIYTGLLLGGAAVVALGGRLSRVLAWLALTGLLWLKAHFEERHLTKRFPDYPSYARTTPRLIPNFRRRRGA